MNLYDIADNIRVLADMAEEFDPETIADTLEALEGDLEQKADSIGKLCKMLDRQADACELEAIRLKDRAAHTRKRREAVTNYLEAAMKVMGKARIETDLFNISLRRLPPVIELDDELLPKKWLVVRESFRPDKIAIKAALQTGNTIPGATLVTDRQRLYIK
ncbi:MAG: siphovirus Gp157 family protein [Pseudomonadales bacterium]